jgi:hypothetical protein
MANLDFYAVTDDLRSLMQFVFNETDIIAYELSSEHNDELRAFRSLSELEKVFILGSPHSIFLQLWSPTVMAEPVIRRIDMMALPGRPFRYGVEGVGLMQLYLGGVRDQMIFHTHFGHWNEAGARRRSMYSVDDCDWRALSRLSGRIQRYVRGRLAFAKLYSCPVLHHAYACVQNGFSLSYGLNIHCAQSQDIIRNGA